MRDLVWDFLCQYLTYSVTEFVGGGSHAADTAVIGNQVHIHRRTLVVTDIAIAATACVGGDGEDTDFVGRAESLIDKVDVIGIHIPLLDGTIDACLDLVFGCLVFVSIKHLRFGPQFLSKSIVIDIRVERVRPSFQSCLTSQKLLLGSYAYVTVSIFQDQYISVDQSTD